MAKLIKSTLEIFINRINAIMGKYIRKTCRIIERMTKSAYKFYFSRVSFKSIPVIPKGYSRSSQDKYIVSLTSWEPRFDVLPIALKSLLLQTRKPDRIILYLGSDVEPDSVPDEVRQFEQKGVEIRFVNENLRAHKKYYYAMKEYPDSTIITVDDDVIYSPFTISSLIKCNKRNKNCVCARRTHRMVFSKGQLMPYNEWKFDSTDKVPCFDLMGTGVGGIMYPPHCLHTDLFDKKLLKQIAFTNDDLWLKGMEMLCETKIKSVNCLWKHPISLLHDDKDALYNMNVLNNENDRILDRLQKQYPGILDKCLEK